jgi:photosystem II stability/assembly factor-like uncharacterized protein
MKKIIIILFLILLIRSIPSQWHVISYVNTTELKCVKFYDLNTGLVCGTGGIWRSTNGGLNWIQSVSGCNINFISLPDIYNCYAVGDSGKIFQSFNNGLNWTNLNSPVTQNLNSAFFINNGKGWVVGDNGKIIVTDNGGGNWSTQSIQFSDNLNCIFMVNATTGYVAGGNIHEVCANTLNGYEWLICWYPSGNGIKGLCVLPGSVSNLISVGQNGSIKRSTNYGYAWTIIAVNTMPDLYAVQFLDNSTGYVCGNYGCVTKSTNSGLNWELQSIPVTYHLRNIYFINANSGWAVGQNGVVIGIGVPVKVEPQVSEIPREFKLYQNYPNPFNPVTTIKFQVSRYSHVKLTVYDILGKEIEVLVNKDLNAGNYSIEWKADNFPSGIYFYKMKAYNFSETKKILLIK